MADTKARAFRERPARTSRGTELARSPRRNSLFQRRMDVPGLRSRASCGSPRFVKINRQRGKATNIWPSFHAPLETGDVVFLADKYLSAGRWENLRLSLHAGLFNDHFCVNDGARTWETLWETVERCNLFLSSSQRTVYSCLICKRASFPLFLVNSRNL